MVRFCVTNKQELEKRTQFKFDTHIRNSFLYLYTKNYQNGTHFEKDIAKVLEIQVFMPHGVCALW